MPKDIPLQDSVDRLAEISKKLAETKEPRKFDFTSTPLGLTIGSSEGTTFANIAKPANFDKVPVGSEAKITVKLPTNPADLPPTDDVQVAMIGTYLWIDKVATNIMNWGEVKTQLQAGKIMVLTRLADTDVQGNTYKVFQLARWEDAPTKSAHWETIDQTTHKFTGSPLVRITFGHRQMTGYLSTDSHHWFFTHWYSADETRNIVYYWATWRHDKTVMSSKLYAKNSSGGEDLTINESDGDITKFEIWKEA